MSASEELVRQVNGIGMRGARHAVPRGQMQEALWPGRVENALVRRTGRPLG